MSKLTTPSTEHPPGRTAPHPEPIEKEGVAESKQPTVSRPGGFKNDPDDPTNPNEAIERHRRKLRP
jgi:hypothetical protein